MLAKLADICKFALRNTRRRAPVKAHVEKCVGGFELENVDILGSTSRGEMHLLTLEALWIREVKLMDNGSETTNIRVILTP